MPCETNLFVRAELQLAAVNWQQATGAAAVEEDAAKGPPLVFASSSIAESVLSAIAAL